ncbi:hypothetical protein BMBphi_gp003 [Bacillus phage vB_BthS_BMBphi]|nr:hypothetical protein BMBphi_gp003 [Bacillus phage vB_BthS_BMBphi]
MNKIQRIIDMYDADEYTEEEAMWAILAVIQQYKEEN